MAAGYEFNSVADFQYKNTQKGCNDFKKCFILEQFNSYFNHRYLVPQYFYHLVYECKQYLAYIARIFRLSYSQIRSKVLKKNPGN